MKCKNCSHEIIRLRNSKWYHIVAYTMRADNEPNLEIKANTKCSWKEETQCKTCHNFEWSDPCGCVKPEPEVD